MIIDDPFQLNAGVIRGLLAKHPDNAIELMQREKLYPSNDQMEEIIKTAFWATLATEEREAIAFSVQFTKPQSNELGDPYIFSEPVMFNIENLVKLALSVNSLKRFGVYPDSKGKLKIWGFGSRSLMGKFNIVTYGAGRIVVSLGQHSLLLTGDKARFVMNGDDLEDTVFWQKSTVVFSDYDRLCRKYLTGRFFQSCRYILAVIRAKKHGGTLLITPAEGDWKLSFEPLRYAASKNWSKASRAFAPLLKQFHRRHDAIDAGLIEESIYPEENWRIEDNYRQSLDDIAFLAIIDGAVVADYNLNVLACGAKIKKQADQPENIPVIEFPYKKVEKAVEEAAKPAWGTRHQSAADYTLDKKDSIAFVSSEDGAATAFTFDTNRNKVIALRHLEYLQAGKFG